MKKTRKTTSKRATAKKVVNKKAPKTTTKKVPVRKIAPKQSPLQKLRLKENASMKAMKDCANEWEAKTAKAKTAEQRRKIDTKYQAKFNKLDRKNTICAIDVEMCKMKNERARLVQLNKAKQNLKKGRK